MSEVKAIFDKAIDLQPGKKILVPAANQSHRESLRTSFYRQRSQWKNAVATREDIIISRLTYQGNFCVVLEKVGAAPPAMILDADGNIEQFLLIKQGIIQSDQEYTEVAPASEEERIRTAMAEDGMSQEEIDEFFAKPEEGKDDKA